MSEPIEFNSEIPTTFTRERIDETLVKYSNWFYEFRFSSGYVTKAEGKELQSIHKTRAALVFPFLDEYYRGRWDGIRCIDIACHQGWFASQVAIRGAKSVLGLDVKESHIEMANAIKCMSSLGNIEFDLKNLYDINRRELGTFDLTLLLGILYHLDNPIGALRIAREMTTDLCLIETQVARPTPHLETAWGSTTKVLSGPVLCVIESDDTHFSGRRASVIVPTLDALYSMIFSAGFDRAYLCVPPPEMHRQYPSFDRVVVVAQVLRQ